MKDHPFKMPLYPMSNYLAIASLLVILVFMFLNPETTVSLMVGVVFLVVMTLLYFIKERKSVKVASIDESQTTDDTDAEELD